MIAAVRLRTSPTTTLKERLLHLKAGEYDGTGVERRAKINPNTALQRGGSGAGCR